MKFQVRRVGIYKNVDIHVNDIIVFLGLLNQEERNELANTLIDTAFDLLTQEEFNVIIEKYKS